MDRYDEIKSIIAKILAITPETVTRDSHLHFDLGADSLGLENLALAISEKYGIELLGEELVELENVGELVLLVDAKINVLK